MEFGIYLEDIISCLSEKQMRLASLSPLRSVDEIEGIEVIEGIEMHTKIEIAGKQEQIFLLKKDNSSFEL